MDLLIICELQDEHNRARGGPFRRHVGGARREESDLTHRMAEFDQEQSPASSLSILNGEEDKQAMSPTLRNISQKNYAGSGELLL